MKKNQKKIFAIFTLLLVLGNFFIGNFTYVVDALSSGEVYNYSVSVKGKIDALKEKVLLSKNDILYQTDNSYKVSVDYMEQDALKIENELNEKINMLDQGISLKTLIDTHFSTKKVEYETYMIDDQTIINIDDIKDITYIITEPSYEEKTLLTKDEIILVINDNYLKPIYNKIDNLVNNYDDIILSYRNSYNNVITNINNYIIEIDNKKIEIDNYVLDENNLSNIPNMIVDDTNIYDLIDFNKEKLSYEKNGITIENITEKNNAILNIKNDILSKINTFWLNNKTYLELETDKSITELENKYSNSNTCLTNWFTNIDIYKNDRYGDYKDNLDINLINCYKEIINLESEYNTLNNDINKYLERKPSDEDSINILLVNLNNYRTYLNSDKVLTHIDNLVMELENEDEDTIDLLYNFLSIDEVSYETKEQIKIAKTRFYELNLKDNNYNLEINGNYILISQIIGGLTKEELSNLLDYNANFKYSSDESILTLTNDTKLILLDRDDKVLKEYFILFVGDTDNDLDVDNDDLAILRKQVLEEKELTLEKIDIFDINKDEKIDIKDVSLLNNKLNPNNPVIGETTNVSFNIERIEKDNLVYYNIYLSSDGIIDSFEFKTKFSEDLLFKNFVTTLDGVNNGVFEDYIKVVGYGNYKDKDLLGTLIYEKVVDSSLEQTTFELKDIIAIFDNLNNKDISSLVNVYKKPVLKEEKVTVEVLNNEVLESEEVIEVIEEEVKQEEEIKEQEEVIDDPIEEEITEKEIIWGNVVKIIVVVLLGTLIIYFLNKKDESDEINLN